MRNAKWFILALLLVATVLPAAAQTVSQVLINYTQLAEEADGLGIDVYFNLTDSTGRVATAAEVASARILLDDGTSYDATVEKPTSPIYITLILDASGSMGSAAQSMREAAIQAVNDAPEEAQFTVIRFNDQIDLLVDQFTSDRNRIINAIGEVQPRNLAGTCLYDAAYRGIELVNTAPAGRRAIILFTDGRDELASGEVCSTRVYDEVVDLASRPESRVPIFTIGLSGGNSAINSSELRSIASATGGISAIGTQQELTGVFGQIIDALKAQWLAQALIYPTQGQHTAQVLVTLSDNTFPQPALAVFTSPRDYQRTPTVTPTQPTPTPTIVEIAVESVAADPSTETLSVQGRVENEQLVSEYRFEFKNANNLLQAEFVVPAPLPDSNTFPARSLDSGDLTVELIGLDADGRIVARSEPYEFAYLRPTATALPPTNTPEPVSATLTGIMYDEATDQITLNVSLLGGEQIASLQINVVNADTNLLEETYSVEPGTLIDLPSTGLLPGQDYKVNIIAQSPNGQIISQSDDTFRYTPLLTPTATPVLVDVAISAIDVNDSYDAFIIQIATQNETEIAGYQLRLVETESGLAVGDFEFAVPPFDTITVPLTDIAAGQYNITLNALDADGAVLDTFSVQARYSPPTPTPTMTPTPTATPLAGLDAFVAQAQDNPIIIIVIAGIALALGLLLFLITRRPKAKTGTNFLQELTSVQQTPIQPGRKAAQPGAPVPVQDATNAIPMGGMGDPDATNVLPQMLLPRATLIVNRTRDEGMTGKSVDIDHVPFTFGRRDRDMNFPGDDNVSRNHAQITYTDGKFYLTDEGSTHGTLIDGTRLTPRAATPLRPGARITLGTTTLLTFETERGAAEDFDPDRTNL